MERQDICDEHDKKKTYFCVDKNCQEASRLCCSKCVISGCHKKHDVEEIEDV